MKRIITLFLVIATTLSLVACQKYEPVESTKLEATPVATLSYGKENYKVKYELFRAMLLSAKETVSDGDLTRFDGEKGAALLEEARAVALDKIYEIYTAFALCDALKINLYSKDVDKKVEESIEISIEGGYAENGQAIEGLGSYEAYLENLKLFYANYAVQDLLIRYSYGVSALLSYYRGTYDSYGNQSAEGAITYTDSQITDFYNSDSTRRLFIVFTQKDAEDASALRDKIAAQAGDAMVSAYLLGHTTASEADAKDGIVIGEYTLDAINYKEVTEAAFALNEGETSEIIPALKDGEAGYFILYRAQKSAENLEEIRKSVAKNYVENEIGKRLAEAKAALAESAQFTDFYKGLVLSAISMDEENQ